MTIHKNPLIQPQMSYEQLAAHVKDMMQLCAAHNAKLREDRKAHKAAKKAAQAKANEILTANGFFEQYPSYLVSLSDG